MSGDGVCCAAGTDSESGAVVGCNLQEPPAAAPRRVVAERVAGAVVAQGEAPAKGGRGADARESAAVVVAVA